MSEALLKARKIRRKLGREPVIDEIDLELMAGEFLVILGPSGCGKTTLLNILAGFDKGAESRRLNGVEIRGACPEIGVIFQEGSLFPWLTVARNIAFGDRVQGMNDGERERAVARYVTQFELEGLEGKYPDQLSGGEMQRAAVARALINHPQILLADEPFRALDSPTRLESQAFLWKEIRSRNQTLCLVTHDIDEALLLGERLVILSERPAKVLGIFEVGLAAERNAMTVLTSEFHREKQRFVDYCREIGAPLFPEEEGP